MTRTLISCISIALAALSAGCGGDDSEAKREDLRIYHSPYSEVDWVSDFRLKGQHHDHVALDKNRIRAYDAAGYHAIAPLDYSGAPNLPYALRQRIWPIEDFLSAEFLQSLGNLRIWFPAAEEVGVLQHVTSPFLGTYIEAWSAAHSPTKQPWQYSDLNEMFALIRAGGGLPLLAHPWTQGQSYGTLPGLFGVEIYSAYAEARRRSGIRDFVDVDRNAVLLQNWDRALASNQTIIGFAVNDHFGPIPDLPVDDDIRDSGKIIVLAKAKSLEEYRAALERGAVLAVRDMGLVKDKYPIVESIVVGRDRATINSDAPVRWIANGSRVSDQATLNYSELPARSTYVRAEIRGLDGSTVYTQAFWVRPVGDADGDGGVTTADRAICEAVANGTETNRDRISSCEN